MSAEYISLDPNAVDAPDVRRAAEALADGALVAFPTETVYGLAANAANSDSVERIRKVKARGKTQPFTVHIGEASAAEDYVPEISRMGRRFIRKAWPGPVTLVFKVSDPTKARTHERLSDPGAALIYTDKSVGIRFPDHPIAAALIRKAGAPIIASSANVSGRAAPVEADSIMAELGDGVDIILDAGATRYRKPSTIVSLNGDGYRLLRTGVWDERIIKRLSTINILFVCTGNTCRSPMAEGMCKHMLADRLGCQVGDLPDQGVVVQSAGTMGYSGGRASPEAIEVCRKRGIDISGHSSRGLVAELIHPADYIFAMARHHIDAVRSIAPGDADKAIPLNVDGDVFDPIGGSLDDYERVAEVITKALKDRLNEVVV